MKRLPQLAALTLALLCLPTSPLAAQALVLGQTSTDATTGERLLSPLKTFDFVDTTGAVVQTRQFKYTTPVDFALRGAQSVNLWFVFHGGGGNTNTMNRYFDVISATSPTVIVFPEAMGSTWQGIRQAGDETLQGSFYDVIFIEQLVQHLLADNPQLHPRKVYASGFSSGANQTWMLLCFRSQLFRGFGLASQPLRQAKVNGGCGNGRLQDPITATWTVQTGYEQFTGRQPDRYGYSPSLPANKAVNPSKPVFYSHGTLDDNLVFTGAPNCFADGLCDLDEDPNFSMDPGGVNQDRDDISSVDWLLDRHDLSHTSFPGVLPDEVPLFRDDSVVTTARTYQTSLATPVVSSRQPVRWLELVGGVHAMSAFDHEGDVCPATNCNTTPGASKDYETSLEMKEFFEAFAEMLP